MRKSYEFQEELPDDTLLTPVEDPNAIRRRSWLSVEFSGLNLTDPEPTSSSLFRRWSGEITAMRSDNVTIQVPVYGPQSDISGIGKNIHRAFKVLATYLNCACNSGSTCPEHLNQI